MAASIDNRHFLMRRIHSLLGLIPIGAFLVFHIWENSQSRLGADHYNTHVVEFIKSFNYIVFFEVFLIAIPILFHAIYGVMIGLKAKSNVRQFGTFRNRMWWFQRMSGWAIIAFLLLHVGLTRIYSLFAADTHLVNTNMHAFMHDQLSQVWMFAIYVLGLTIAAVHLCNGLFTAGITWGLTTTPRAQKIATVVWAGLCIIIVAMGIHSLMGFFTDQPDTVTATLEVLP